MRDPLELIRFETDTPVGAAGAPTLVVALGGLIDAGHLQSLVVRHLLKSLDHTVVATFDVDQLIDYRGRRPLMVFDQNRFSSYDDPSMTLYRVIDDNGEPFLVLAGPEPDYQWERVIEAIHFLIRRLRVKRVVDFQGVPMAVPHTRPVGMSMYATQPGLIPDDEPDIFGKVQIPASLESLLYLRLGEVGVEALGYAVHVPHYLAQFEFVDAAVAVLDRLAAVTGLSLPVSGLAVRAEANRAEINEQIESNPEMAEAVRGMEQQYDAFVEGTKRQNLLATELAELPNGDEIAAQAQEFLRESEDGDLDEGRHPGTEGRDEEE